MSTLPRQITLLRNATLADGQRVDVELDGAFVTGVHPSGSLDTDDPRADESRDPAETLELAGFLLLPAPAEPHAHLDKALSWDLINPPMGDLGLAIASWRAYSASMTTSSIADRAREAALLLLQNGTTAIRSHVDILIGEDPLRGVRALTRMRDELHGLIDIELVALAGPDAPDDHVRAAIEAGVDLVGGAPHLAPRPEEDLDRLLTIADEYGVGADIHTDEGLDGPLTIRQFAEIVGDWPDDRSATASHCVRLGTLDRQTLADVVRELVASKLSVVTLPITNLYLQGWEHPVSTPRGLAPIRALLDGGVVVGAGADNVRDPFNPVGKSDALETASLLVTAGHLTLDEAYRLVSEGARAVMQLPPAGAFVGGAADLLAVRGTNLSDAIADQSADRYVIHAGRLVAHSEVRYTVAPPSAAPSRPLVETR